MKNQFAVIHGTHGGLYERVIFEGDDGDVYAFLKKNSALDAPGFVVVDRLTSTTWEEGTFIREFEEQMSEVNAATGGHKCLSEDRVREIFREELTKVFSFMVDACDETILSVGAESTEGETFGHVQSLIGVARDVYLGRDQK